MRRTPVPPAALPVPLLEALGSAPPGADAAARVVNTWAAAQEGSSRKEVRAVLDAAVDQLRASCAAPVVRVGLRLQPAVRLRFR